jgi:hypothetical protein
MKSSENAPVEPERLRESLLARLVSVTGTMVATVADFVRVTVVGAVVSARVVSPKVHQVST